MGRRNSAARDIEALRLRQDGQTYDEIAEGMSFANRSAAWKAVQRAIKHTDVAATRDEHKAVELARLDQMHAALQDKVNKGELDPLSAIPQQLAISKHRARLLELYSSVNAPRLQTARQDGEVVGGAQVIDLQEAAASIREAMAGKSS